jgi:hypothetical protein
MKTTGTIRRWISEKGWGMAHVYTPGVAEPQKFFVHVSNLLSSDLVLAVGSRITFLVGPPRTAGEFPVALQIELASSQAPDQIGTSTQDTTHVARFVIGGAL